MPNPLLLYRRTHAILRQYENYAPQVQERIEQTLFQIRDYVEQGQAPYGLRIKSLGRNLYEARIDIRLRIVFFKGKEIIKFICVGNHEDVRICFRNLKDLLKG